MQQWLNWGRKEYVSVSVKHNLCSILWDFQTIVAMAENCESAKCLLICDWRWLFTCGHMCSEQWGKIPVGMAGFKNPIGDPLGRGGRKSGGVKMHRVWGCADLRGEAPRRGGGQTSLEEAVRGEDWSRGMMPSSTLSSPLSSINYVY